MDGSRWMDVYTSWVARVGDRGTSSKGDEVMAATLISIQDELIATVNSGYQRWSHRKDGGHSDRIRRGACHQARKALLRIGYDEAKITQLIKDALDIAKLERDAGE